MSAQVARVERALNIGVAQLAQASARSAEITPSMAGILPLILAGPVQVSCASSSSLENLRLRALIEGRSVSTTSTTPTSLLEVFVNPICYRQQSLAGFLAEVSGELCKKIETELKDRPLSPNGEHKLTVELINLKRENNKKVMQEKSTPFGWEFVKGLGYVFEPEYITDKPREFLIGVIGLANVGKRLCDWLGEGRGDGERIEAIVQLQVVAEMILEKEAEWDKFRRSIVKWLWGAAGRAITASECKTIYWEEGYSDFVGIRLFGKEEDRDFSGANFNKGKILTRADFHDANLTGANFKDADVGRAYFYEATLTDVDFQGANLQGAEIDRKALLTLNTGEWAGKKTLAQRKAAWRKRGGVVVKERK